MFVSAVHQTIIDWVQLPDCNVFDVGALYTLLCSLTRRFGGDGTVRTVPLVFKLQNLVKEGKIKQTSRQRAVAAAILEWFGMVAKVHFIERLTTYLKQVKDERVAHKEYSPIFLPGVADTVAHIREFDELEPENTTPVDKFLDRHVIVEILSKDGQLRDEEDTHGLDLESKLYVEWGSEAFGKFTTARMWIYISFPLHSNDHLLQSTKNDRLEFAPHAISKNSSRSLQHLGRMETLQT